MHIYNCTHQHLSKYTPSFILLEMCFILFPLYFSGKEMRKFLYLETTMENIQFSKQKLSQIRHSFSHTTLICDQLKNLEKITSLIEPSYIY